MKTKTVLALFAAYEVIAYFVNRANYQSSATGSGGWSVVLPFDLIGSMIGYGAAPAAATTTSGLAAYMPHAPALVQRPH